MKKFLFSSTVLFFCGGLIQADVIPSVPESRSVFASSGVVVRASSAPIVFQNISNNAFCVGEKLTFVIKYEFVKAGFASMEVSQAPLVEGRSAILIESRAESVGMVDSFFKVRDFNASTADEASLISRNFHQNLKEGGYKVIRNTALDYKNHTYKYQRIKNSKTTERSGPVTQPLYDILSAFYYARTLPLKPGGRYEITVFSDEEVYPLAVKVFPKLQSITVPAGKFECIRIEPTFLGDGIFKAKDGKMTVWLTNDEKRMPVLIRSRVFIGAVDAELTEFKYGGTEGFDTPGTK